MIPLNGIRHLFDYNYWARDRQLECCRQASSEQFLRPLGSSFSSLRDTLSHLVAAEWIWLERWRGRSPNLMEVRATFAPASFPTLDAVRDRWREIEKGNRECLGSLSDATLARPLTYVNFRGETTSYPLWETLFHVINHQTYHRGQVTTLLRQLGLPVTELDYLVMQDHASRGQTA